jgi:hypothetical protein
MVYRGHKCNFSQEESDMYVRVYAPNGEPFDVSRDRADHLILNAGWTQSVTQDTAPDPENYVIEKSPRRKRKLADASTPEEE